jgi:hypothetical protein
MISKYLKDIKKILKAYHKKYDAFGNKKNKSIKRKRKK